MHDVEKISISDQILTILKKTTRPLSSRELGIRLRMSGIKISEYEIIHQLRALW